MSIDPRDRIRHYTEAWLPEVPPQRLAGLGGFIIQQLKADGFSLVAGCDCGGAQCSLTADDERHGSNNGYTNCGCRCTPCRAGHAAEKRERQQIST